MARLTSRFRKSPSKVTGSLDFLNIRGFFDEYREENHLKWLTFSSAPVSLLPVYLASADHTESETIRRASNISVLTPTELNWSMGTRTFPQSFSRLPNCKWQADPFRATALWENTVFHLENSIKSGRHTRGLKIYNNCFRGADAVACLSTYLNTVLPKTVSRQQVLVLCQKLVMTGVMEDVKDKERTMFKEGRLYRFSKEHFWQQPAAAEEDSSPTLCRYQSPTAQDTQTEKRKMKRHTPLISSVKYPSDSTIAVSSRFKHIHHYFHRQTSHEPHSEFKQRYTTGQKLKKARSCVIRDTNNFRSDPPPPECNRHSPVKLSRRNAMKRGSRPWPLVLKVARGKDQGGVCKATTPAQRSQSQSYRIKDTPTSCKIGLEKKFPDKKHLQMEKEGMDGVKGNTGKLATMKENDHVVKGYCVDTSPGPGHHVDRLRLFNVYMNPVSSVREDVQTAAPPAGMNWVVYGYL